MERFARRFKRRRIALGNGDLLQHWFISRRIFHAIGYRKSNKLNCLLLLSSVIKRNCESETMATSFLVVVIGKNFFSNVRRIYAARSRNQFYWSGLELKFIACNFFTTYYIHCVSKNVPLRHCPYLRKILTDFRNSFTGTCRVKFAIMGLLISHHTLTASPHYLVKYKFSKITIIWINTYAKIIF